MHRLLRHLLAAAWLAAAPCAVMADAADAAHAWSRLRFEHQGLALDATLDISRDTLAAAAFPAGDAPPSGALGPAGETVGRLVASSGFRVSPLFTRQRSSVLWFEPSNHAALIHTRETTGIGAGYRISHYAGNGVDVAKASPATRAERTSAPSTWTKISRAFAAYEDAAGNCTVVSDPLMLLLLDPASLPQGFCVTSKKRLLRAVFSQPVEENTSTELRIHHADGSTASAHVTRVRRYFLHLVPVDGGQHTDASEAFLGLHGKIEIQVDARTATPLRLRGTAHLLGKVDLRLREVWLARE